jgi:hypothetical protein
VLLAGGHSSRRAAARPAEEVPIRDSALRLGFLAVKLSLFEFPGFTGKCFEARNQVLIPLLFHGGTPAQTIPGEAEGEREQTRQDSEQYWHHSNFIMKLFALLALAAAAFAQTNISNAPYISNVPYIAATPAGPLVAAASVTAVLSDQGTDVIQKTTGYTPKTATLARVDFCNETASDVTINTSRVASEITLQEQYALYSSVVVDAVLAVLQQKDVYTKFEKLIQAGQTSIPLIAALFKNISPLAVGLSQVAPQVALAILPAIVDPRDLAALSKNLLQDDTTIVLGKRGSGNDCRTGLIVAHTAAVKIEKIAIQ